MFALGISSLAAAGDDSDWRLELLRKEGISSETSSLQKLEKGFVVSNSILEAAVAQLGAETFATREEAQREILRMGKDVLPLLRQLPQSDEPEVRQRLAAIRRNLEEGGRWKREDLLRQAVTSLLRERLNKDDPGTAGRLFVEFFEHPLPSLADGYRKFRFEAGNAMTGRVADGQLRLSGNHADDGDQRLVLDARQLTGKETFPDAFRIEVRLGGDPGGEGGYHVGVSVGNVRALFHPGYQTGGFRFQRVDNQEQITENAALGFDPESGKLMRMSLSVKRVPGGKVELEVVVSNGSKSFTERKILEESVIGKLNQISLDRSGRTGGDGLFDELVVDTGDR